MIRYLGRFRVVAIRDGSRGDALKMLEQSTSEGVSGIKLSPFERSMDYNPWSLWKRAERLGLIVSSLGRVEEFASKGFFRLVSLVRDLIIVLDHLVGIRVQDKDSLKVYRQALELSNYPNVKIKVGGLGDICEGRSCLVNELHMYPNSEGIEMGLQAFGKKCMMWGSDYPSVSNREGYRNVLDGVKNYPAFKTDE
jgi:L-fuconolactonase